jgi:hypothetical protein
MWVKRKSFQGYFCTGQVGEWWSYKTEQELQEEVHILVRGGRRKIRCSFWENESCMGSSAFEAGFQ